MTIFGAMRNDWNGGRQKKTYFEKNMCHMKTTLVMCVCVCVYASSSLFLATKISFVIFLIEPESHTNDVCTKSVSKRLTGNIAYPITMVKCNEKPTTTITTKIASNQTKRIHMNNRRKKAGSNRSGTKKTCCFAFFFSF